MARLLEQRRRRRRAAHEPEHLGLERLGLVGADDRRQDGRRGAQVGDALLGQRVPDRLGLDLRQADVLGAHRRDRPRIGPAVAVEHRERPQVARARRQARLGDHAQRVQVGAAVVGHHALRAAGRARGVVDRDQRALVLGALEVDRVGVGEQLLVVGVLVALLDPDDPRRVVAELLERRVERLLQRPVGDQHLRPAVLEDVGVLGRGEARVERHQHAADAGHGVVQLEHRRDVGQQHREAVAGLDAELVADGGGGAADAVVVLGVGPACACPRRPRGAPSTRRRCARGSAAGSGRSWRPPRPALRRTVALAW